MNSWIALISSCNQTSQYAALVLDSLLKSLVVLALAGGICALWRRSSAAARHLAWFLAVASLPFLPLLSLVHLSWQRPLWSVSTDVDSGNWVSLALEFSPGILAKQPQPAQGIVDRPTDASGSSGNSRKLAVHLNANWLGLGFAAWFAGFALLLTSVVVEQLRLRKIFRTTARLRNPDWALLLKETCQNLRVHRAVILLQSADSIMPLTWGWWRPAVLLPREAEEWSVERRRIVLLHELAHVKRMDCLTQLAAKIVCAMFWLNPLVWLAARRMCIEREGACDDLVLSAGCRASDYAGHLVDIAGSFRRVPRMAAIAMAGSSQLAGRVAAIVDRSRNRRLRSGTALITLAVAGGMALCLGGNETTIANAGTSASNPLRNQQMARLQAFSSAKEKQSETLAAAAGERISPEFRQFFAAATQGDWHTVTNLYASFRQRHPSFGNKHFEVSLRTSYWQPVLEICLAYDQVVNGEPKYTQIAVDEIMNAVPAGSIYFGGTDAGRGLPTAFCRSQAKADPFYTLTQNALADGSYLEYLRNTYGGQAALLDALGEARRADSQLQALDAEWQATLQKLDSMEIDEADPQYKAAVAACGDLGRKRDERMEIIRADVQARAGALIPDEKRQAQTNRINIPTGEDSQRCFMEYIKGAQERLKNHQLKPGENVKQDNGRIMVSGQTAVMEINALLVKIIFDKNPDHEFFIEESFPLDWMYPYLEPRGLIFKINRKPLAEVPGADVQRDHNYWASLVRPMLGDWLADDTSVEDVAAFAEKVFLRHDLGGFTGDPRFVRNDDSCKLFSKLRTSIAGLYAWRAAHAATSEEQKRMAREADFAFRQALAMCPYLPETGKRYAEFLKSRDRQAEATLVTRATERLNPAKR